VGKLLIGFHHGIGDFINFTPALRALSKNYSEIHLCCKPDLITSGFLSKCPYVAKTIPRLEHPWVPERSQILAKNMQIYLELLKPENFDNQFYLPDNPLGQKAEVYVDFCCLAAAGFDKQDEDSWRFEVWPNTGSRQDLLRQIENLRPYVFVHNQTPLHPIKSFSIDDLPELQDFKGHVLNTADPSQARQDINDWFVLLTMADRVVVADSVFMWAAIALNKTMDYVYFAVKDSRAYPLPFQRRLIKRCNIDFDKPAWI